jgi:phosphatidylglycerophosphate synthase
LLPQAVVLVGIGQASGWGLTGWLVAIVTTATLDVLVVHGMRPERTASLGPADIVTLTRATLTCAVAALVATSLRSGELIDSSPWTTMITALAGLSLVLDLVDGQVARATGTASAFGARFDGEMDAFLMLVLSAWVAPALGWWALTIGLARYVFAAAGWILPWLRARLPPRYWRKVVTASASTILVVASAGVLPPPAVDSCLVVALVLVAESFGRDIWWLWRHRTAARSIRVASP